MGRHRNSLLFTIVVRPMDLVRHRIEMIQTVVICRNKTRISMMVSTNQIIRMMAIKMIITSHEINGRINRSHMVVVVRLIVVRVHRDRTEIQVRKMTLDIKDHPKPNADPVITLEIRTKTHLGVVIIIMVQKAV